MIELVHAFLPDIKQWAGLGTVVLTVIVFTGLGRLPGVSRDLPGASILYGWAIVTAAMTLIGVFTSWSFAPAFWGLAGLSVLMFGHACFRGQIPLVRMLPVLLLGTPLLLIVTGKVPSEVDSFSHWLPNGLYIFEHDQFLRGDWRTSGSVYPGFPYNVTFLFYITGKFAGLFVENAVILFNVLLLIMFAGMLGWLLRRSGAVGEGKTWQLAALSLLLATILSPVFVRRIWLTSYPDMATSVVVAFSGIAAWLWLEAVARNEEGERGRAMAFGLLLLLLVNIKQANLVLMVALVIATGMVAMRDRAIGLALYCRRLAVFALLPFALYFTWRYYLVEVTPLPENKTLPFAEWPFDLVPDLLWNMGIVIYRKALYFALALGFVAWGLRVWIGRPATSFDRLAILVGASFVGYNLFLLLIFIAHFNGYPQSYWRFNTHIGYLVLAATVYGLGLVYCRYETRLTAGVKTGVRRAGLTLVVLVPVMELSLTSYWRFDLEIPKPLLREAGRELSVELPPNARIAVIVPGDVGDFTAIFLHYVKKSRPDISTAIVATREQVVKFAGSDTGAPLYLWAYCPTTWIDQALGTVVQPGQAALLRRDAGGWRVAETWPHRPAGGLIKVYKLFDLSQCAGGD